MVGRLVRVCRSPRDRGVQRRGRTASFAKYSVALHATVGATSPRPPDRKTSSTGETRMASIHEETLIDARPEDVWAALRDVGALHTRLVPGFVVDTRLEDGARIVTFGTGMDDREL